MPRILSLAALFLVTALAGARAFAVDTHLPVPGQGWEVRIDAPAFDKRDEKNHPDQYMMSGSGGRFNLSFFVETPTCAAGLTNEALYACYKVALRRDPAVMPETVRANEVDKGVAVMYMRQGEYKGTKYMQFNVNVLFGHGGKQGDLHASMIAPETADLATMIKIAESFNVVDTPDAAK